MEGYDFLGGDDSTEAQTTTTTDMDIKRWSLGDHQEDVTTDWSNIEQSIENIEDAAPGLSEALNEAKQTVENFDVNGFECAVCGLNHSHSDSKHDIRSIFNVTSEFAEEMKFSPFCHCGVSELARLVMYFPEVNGVAMFEDQHEFESVQEMNPSDVRAIHKAMNEVTIEEAGEYDLKLSGLPDRTLNFSEAIEYERRRSGVELPADIRPELKKFYDRVDRIRSAASNAPIPSKTEQSLNENLGEM